MDAFYASVELLRRPELRDFPVAIGGTGDPSRRGVLTTANYVARKFGLRSGMPMRTAKKLCPDAIFLPVDFPEYRRMSRLFKTAILEICSQMEDRGIDEVYLDLGADNPDPIGTAKQLRQSVFDATGLTCSVGLAPNKLIAKIASDLDKPNGLTVINTEDIQTRIWPLPASKVPGIGPKAFKTLQELQLSTIGDIATSSLDILQSRFTANFSNWMIQACQGNWRTPIVTEQERKSYSRETTFEQDLSSDEECARVMANLSRRLEKDLLSKSLAARTIGVKIRFTDFTTITRDISPSNAVKDAKAIYNLAWECYDRVPRNLPRLKIRLVGVRLSNFIEAQLAQLPNASAEQAQEAPGLYTQIPLPLFR
jgi:DNA polymerase IV